MQRITPSRLNERNETWPPESSFVRIQASLRVFEPDRTVAVHHLDFRDLPVSRIRAALSQRSRGSGKSPDELLDVQIQSLLEPTEGVDYETWIERVERAESADGLGTVQYELSDLPYAPLISVLLPVSRLPESFLRACLDSVLAQTYPRWELCIAEDASSGSRGHRLLDAYRVRDERIRVAGPPGHGNLSGALNQLVDMARGEYLALLGHDDTLASSAFAFVVEALQKRPRARLLYSDEDRIDAEGRRFAPHFKSGWNPDLLYCHDYVGHLSAFELDLARAAGGMRRGLEGHEHHDFILRASAQLDERLIRHVPQVLYHRRAHGEDAVSRPGDRAWEAGRRVLQSFFDGGHRGVRVERGLAPFTYRPRWPLPDPPPLVSVIVPTRDNARLLETCVSSVLAKTRYGNFEVLVVDNDSRDPAAVAYLARARADERVRVLKYPGKFNFSAINNFAAAEAAGDVLCLLNDDTEVIEPGWLGELVSHACRPEIGCVGAKLLYPDGRIQHGGVICGVGGIAGHSHRYFPGDHGGYCSRLLLIQNLSAVTAACLAVRRAVWEAAGGMMNAADLPVAFNDVDFCLRVRRMGLRNLWTPYALLRHYESASRGKDIARRNKKRFSREADYMRATWGDYLPRDPYYSPHLSLKREDFSLSPRRGYNLTFRSSQAVKSMLESSGRLEAAMTIPGTRSRPE